RSRAARQASAASASVARRARCSSASISRASSASSCSTSRASSGSSAASSRASSASAFVSDSSALMSRGLLSLDPTQDAVHKPGGVVGCIALRERHRLVDRDLGRDLAPLELVDRDPQRAPLDDAEPVRRPPFRRRRDALVEGGGVGGRLLRERPRPRIDLPRVLGADLLAGQIPLVEQEESLASRLPAADQPTGSISSASVDVEYSPLENSSLLITALASSRVDGTPSITVSSRARKARAIAEGRSSSHTTSFASSES